MSRGKIMVQKLYNRIFNRIFVISLIFSFLSAMLFKYIFIIVLGELDLSNLLSPGTLCYFFTFILSGKIFTILLQYMLLENEHNGYKMDIGSLLNPESPGQSSGTSNTAPGNSNTAPGNTNTSPGNPSSSSVNQGSNQEDGNNRLTSNGLDVSSTRNFGESLETKCVEIAATKPSGGRAVTSVTLRELNIRRGSPE
jgi:hypothetical protein